MAKILLGKEIKIPEYTDEQKEFWIDKDCPSYTGIMAVVNNISFQKHGCFVDVLGPDERNACFDDAVGTVGYFKMPE